ncbi:lipopolysaccharide biosynthesis protein, partial [Vibrio parahaemolyticus]|uniref:lipopolysaccharide biosynthesis protein n=1 Tax=Vibrio parahaemolyticus TaxID=670 RepID=UPI00215C9451
MGKLKLISNGIIKNIILLATGSIMAQAITLVSSPILTRIYGPSELGVLGNYMAIINVIMPISALCFPLAIVLTKSEDEAKEVASTASIVSLLLSFLSATVIVFIKDIYVLPFNGFYLFFIPVVIIFSTQLQISQQLLIKDEKFRVISKLSVAHSFIINLMKIVGGLFYNTAITLILVASFSPGVNFLLLRRFSNNKGTHNIYCFKKIFIRYYDFAFYRTPQVLLNGISNSIPIFMLTYYFGAKYAGFYAIANSVLTIPTLLVSKSVSDVFYPKFSKLINSSPREAVKLFNIATLSLIPVAAVPLIIFGLFSPELFNFVFGSGWSVSGEYAQVIALASFVALVSRPAITAIAPLKLQ